MNYDAIYREFDSPLAQRIRAEAYGEDIGQHSWVRADELRRDVAALRLAPSSRFLDLGCGPCGPLAFVVRLTGCSGTGADVSVSALAAGRRCAASLGLSDRTAFREVDLDGPLPFAAGTFDAAMALDVVLHLADRARFYREVARALVPGGRFLMTDAGVVTGSVSGEEIRARTLYGPVELVAAGVNERLLGAAGLRLLESEDRTASLLESAAGRRDARARHRRELEALEGREGFERQQEYLDTVVALGRRGALSRRMYVCETVAAAASSRMV